MDLDFRTEAYRSLGRMGYRLERHPRVQRGFGTEFARLRTGCWREHVVVVRADLAVDDFRTRSLARGVGLVMEFEGLRIGTIPSFQIQLGFEADKMIGWLASLGLMPMRLDDGILVVWSYVWDSLLLMFRFAFFTSNRRLYKPLFNVKVGVKMAA